jgi:hypothetical protein
MTDSAQVNIGHTDNCYVGLSINSFSDKVGCHDAYSRHKSIYRVFSDKSSAKDGYSRSKSIHRSFSDAVGALDLYKRVKSINRSLADSVGMVDSYVRNKSIVRSIADTVHAHDNYVRSKSIHRIISDLIGVLDNYTYKYYPYYLKLGAVLTNLTTVTFIDQNGGETEIENVKEIRWGDLNPFLKIDIPYAPVPKFQQIIPVKVVVTIICLNVDQLISALVNSGAYDFNTMHRQTLNSLTIAASNIKGDIITFKFNNIQLEILTITGLTEKVGECQWLVRFHCTDWGKV